MAKIIVICGWAIAISSFFINHSLAEYGKYLFFFLCFAHLGEFLFFYGKMKKSGGSMIGHFVKTMLFGMVHISPIIRRRS